MNHVKSSCKVSNAGRILLKLLFVGVLATGCASAAGQKELKPVDKVLLGVSNPKMKQVWKQAEAKGELPPIEAIPTPKKHLTKREPTVVKEPVAPKRPPIITDKTLAKVEPFSLTPIVKYDGLFQVTKHEPGVLTGRLQQRDEQLELYYKLPGKLRSIPVSKTSELALSLRDEVAESALQRSIVLRNKEGEIQLVYIAEGSDKTYRRTIKSLNLIIEQEEGYGSPPVSITYAGTTITLKEGEKQKVGDGQQTAEVFLITSTAMSPQQAMVREGQPYYVRLIMYKSSP